MSWLEIRLILMMMALLTIPGWAFLSVGSSWQRWSPLQRWIVAIGVSISFWPVLFYFSRLIIPSFQWGARRELVLLVVLLFFVLYQQRKVWKSHFSFETLERLAIFVCAAAVVNRLWIAHLYPYPAWSDSLHHTLLTQLVAQNGRLPYTLAPYEPAVLNMYHLGLYAITGVVEQMANVPATTALLWTSQLLNGLTGLGIYLALDYFAGRKGALVGALVVGFFSFQPAWYVNWGRFTQVASQAILPIAWVVTYEAIQCWGETKGVLNKSVLILGAALLNAGVFLLHFRVAGLYIGLLALSVAWQGYQAVRSKKGITTLVSVAVIGLLSLVFVSPALWPSLQTYIHGVSAAAGGKATAASETFSPTYYEYTIRSFFTLGSQSWLTVIALLSLVIGILYKNKLSLSMLLWLGVLWLVGNAYRTGLYWLSFVNYTGIIIMDYIPVSILIGAAVQDLISKIRFLQSRKFQTVALDVLLLASVLFGYIRLGGIDAYRFFVTPADVTAMDWINQNIPGDAVFAINTYMWMGVVPQGTDAGYWIPYYTHRQTTTGTMLFSTGPDKYANQILRWSNDVTQLVQTPDYAQRLCQEGVRYVYIGAKGNFAGHGMTPDNLQYPETKILYQRNGVTILRLCDN